MLDTGKTVPIRVEAWVGGWSTPTECCSGTGSTCPLFPGSRGSAVCHPPRVRELFYLLLLNLVGRRCVIRHESGNLPVFVSWISWVGGVSSATSPGTLLPSPPGISWVGGVSSATSPGTLLLSLSLWIESRHIRRSRSIFKLWQSR